MACSSECVCLHPPPVISSVDNAALREHVEKDRASVHCHEPDRQPVTGLWVENATAQLQNGSHFVCLTPTNSSLNDNRT